MRKKIPRLKKLQEVMKGQDESNTKKLTQQQFKRAKNNAFHAKFPRFTKPSKRRKCFKKKYVT